ncbi:MAG: kynureninase [Deinococcales bacterium]
MDASQDPARARAEQLDREDALAPYRETFVLDDAPRIYLDGNSLGRLPRGTRERLATVVEQEWGRDLIASWGRGWVDAPRRIGERIAPLIGAGPGQVVVSDSTTVNLYKLAGAALAARPGRPKVVSDAMNFPSDLYTLESAVRSAGGSAALQVVPGAGDGVRPDLDALLGAIDETTALVVLSHVSFKSGYLHDAGVVGARAREVGAWVLWDLSHSVGVVPIELDAWEAELAVGCTYKYLNGGPGAPAFLYVRRDLQERLRSPVEGWFGRRAPFGFDLGYEPADGVGRFLVGTPPMLSLLAIEAGLEPLEQAGLAAVRAKSEALTAFLIELADARLLPLGFALGTPRDPARRGSHVSLRHPDGYRINRALIDADVVPDFREPDTIRLGLAPLYTRFVDVWEAVDRLVALVESGAHRDYDDARAAVT